jgi:quercetin dioxygenase-like cupin family protein
MPEPAVDRADGVEHPGERAPTSRLSFFAPDDAPTLRESAMMDVGEFAPPGMISADERVLLRHGELVKVLFRHAGDDGFSLVHVSFAPNYLLPRHSHSADCLYYVLRGRVRFGKRSVEAGEGFFIPKDRPYAYQAGPDGVDLLEFRHATSFDFIVHEDKPARWREIVEVARANQAVWAGEWAEERDRAVEA